MSNILQDKAIKLRRKGYSFREIGEILNVAKSTAGVWSRAEQLDEKARARIRQLGDKGRERAIKTNKIKRESIWQKIAMECSVLKDSRDYGSNDYKIFLALLYWAEGEKRSGKFVFVNSDKEMIKLYLSLLRKSFLIDENLFSIWLHLHEYHDQKEMISFWSKVTGICKNQFSVYNKPHTGINKKPGYKGCLSIRYKDSKILKEIFIIIKRLRKFN